MIMRSRYFTKIVILMQDVGKVLCYCMVKYRLSSTYKVTILFGKLAKIFRRALNHCLHHFANQLSLSLSLALFVLFVVIFLLFHLRTGLFSRSLSQPDRCLVYFSLQFLELSFYDYDVKETPLYENQEGYWKDLELFESNWKMKPDIDSQETFSEPPTTAMVQDIFACTPDNNPGSKPEEVSSSGSLETPPVSKCSATKKRRIDLNYEI